MATSSRALSTEDVLALLDQQEELEDTLLAELDAESDDGDLPEGDFTDSDGTQTLVQPELLSSNGFLLVSQALDSPEPAQRDSLLLSDQDLGDESDAAIGKSKSLSQLRYVGL